MPSVTKVSAVSLLLLQVLMVIYASSGNQSHPLYTGDLVQYFKTHSRFLLRVEKPLFFVIWNAVAMTAAWLVAPKTPKIWRLICAAPLLVLVFAALKAIPLALASLLILPVTTIFLIFRTNGPIPETKPKFLRAMALKDIVWGVGLVALLVLVFSAIADLTNHFSERTHGLTGRNYKDTVNSGAAIAALVGSLTMMAFASRYRPSLKHTAAGDNFWPTVAGVCAIGIAILSATVVILTGFTMFGEASKAGGWLVIFFPFLLLAIAIWFIMALFAVFVIHICIITLLAAWHGKVDVGPFNTLLSKVFWLFPKLAGKDQAAAESPVAAMPAAKPSPQQPTFGKRN
jgi:hypothetical protein